MNPRLTQRTFQRKTGVLDLLREHDVAVAIVARKRSISSGRTGSFQT